MGIRPLTLRAPQIKRASPSEGDINATLDITKMALNYAAGGAAALSVLTEPVWFKVIPVVCVRLHFCIVDVRFMKPFCTTDLCQRLCQDLSKGL